MQSLKNAGSASTALLGLTFVCEPVVMWTAGVQKTRQRQVKIAVIGRQAGKRSGYHRDTVIGFHPADDFLFLRPAERIIEIPNQLDLRVVRFRAGIAEEYF